MNTRPARHRIRPAIVATATIATAAALAMPTATAAGGAKWAVISSGNVGNTLETPTMARFGSTYEAVWTAKVGAKYQLQARILNAAGKPLGSVIDVVGKWALLGEAPAIFGIGSTRYIAFTGDREQFANDPYDLSVVDYATSTNGTNWTLGTGSMSHAVNAGGDGPSVVNDAGTPVGAFATAGGVNFHVGIDTSHRPTTAEDGSTSAQPGFSSDAGIGMDNKSHQVWVAFASGNGGAKKDGVWVERILPTMGGTMHAPRSYAAGGATSKGVEQDVSVAARAGGGLYTAYVTAADRSLDVWKIGANKPLATIKDGHGPQDVVVAAAPKGRIWVYWDDGLGWHAARSNKAATKFGPATHLAMPKGTSWNLPIAAVGSAGPLQAVALTSAITKDKNEVITRQVLPRLTIKLSSASVHRGHSFTVHVTDAGDPVKRATVHFGSTKRKTKKKGKVTFKVRRSTSLGKHSVTLTLRGYAPASTKITIKR